MVDATAVYIIGCLYNVLALGKTCKEVVGGVVLRLTVVAIAITRQLLYRLTTGSTSVGELNKVVVAVGNDG